MGLFSDLLNPVKHVKNAKKGLKALNKGDLARALNPSGTLVKESPMEAQVRQALAKKNAAAPTGPTGMFMGARGPTLQLGGGTGGRTYTPNPFSMAPPPAPPGMGAAAPPPTGMAPPTPQVGMAPPPAMGGKPMPMRGSSPKIPPQQQAIIAALRGGNHG